MPGSNDLIKEINDLNETAVRLFETYDDRFKELEVQAVGIVSRLTDITDKNIGLINQAKEGMIAELHGITDEIINARDAAILDINNLKSSSEESIKVLRDKSLQEISSRTDFILEKINEAKVYIDNIIENGKSDITASVNKAKSDIEDMTQSFRVMSDDAKAQLIDLRDTAIQSIDNSKEQALKQIGQAVTYGREDLNRDFIKDKDVLDSITREGGKLLNDTADKGVKEINDAIKEAAKINVTVMSRDEFYAQAEARKAIYNGDGFLEDTSGYSSYNISNSEDHEFANVKLDSTGLSNKLRFFALRAKDTLFVIDGFLFNLKTEYFDFTLPSTNSSGSSIHDQNLVYIETWHEKISDTNRVYKYGNVQYTNYYPIDASKQRTHNSAEHQYYSSPIAGRQAGDVLSRCVLWSLLTEEEQNILLSDPFNNIYKDGDEFIQVRFRLRVATNTGLTGGTFKNGCELVNRTDTQRIKPSGSRVGSENPIDYWVATGSFFKKDVRKKGLYADAPDLIESKSYKKRLCMLPLYIIARPNNGIFHPFFNPRGSKSPKNAVKGDWSSFTNTGRNASAPFYVTAGTNDVVNSKVTSNWDIIDLRKSARLYSNDEALELTRRDLVNGGLSPATKSYGVLGKVRSLGDDMAIGHIVYKVGEGYTGGRNYSNNITKDVFFRKIFMGYTYNDFNDGTLELVAKDVWYGGENIDQKGLSPSSLIHSTNKFFYNTDRKPDVDVLLAGAYSGLIKSIKDLTQVNFVDLEDVLIYDIKQVYNNIHLLVRFTDNGTNKYIIVKGHMAGGRFKTLSAGILDGAYEHLGNDGRVKVVKDNKIYEYYEGKTELDGIQPEGGYNVLCSPFFPVSVENYYNHLVCMVTERSGKYYLEVWYSYFSTTLIKSRIRIDLGGSSIQRFDHHILNGLDYIKYRVNGEDFLAGIDFSFVDAVTTITNISLSLPTIDEGEVKVINHQNLQGEHEIVSYLYGMQEYRTAWTDDYDPFNKNVVQSYCNTRLCGGNSPGSDFSLNKKKVISVGAEGWAKSGNPLPVLLSNKYSMSTRGDSLYESAFQCKKPIKNGTSCDIYFKAKQPKSLALSHTDSYYIYLNIGLANKISTVINIQKFSWAVGMFIDGGRGNGSNNTIAITDLKKKATKLKDNDGVEHEYIIRVRPIADGGKKLGAWLYQDNVFVGKLDYDIVEGEDLYFTVSGRDEYYNNYSNSDNFDETKCQSLDVFYMHEVQETDLLTSIPLDFDPNSEKVEVLSIVANGKGDMNNKFITDYKKVTIGEKGCIVLPYDPSVYGYSDDEKTLWVEEFGAVATFKRRNSFFDVYDHKPSLRLRKPIQVSGTVFYPGNTRLRNTLSKVYADLKTMRFTETPVEKIEDKNGEVVVEYKKRYIADNNITPVAIGYVDSNPRLEDIYPEENAYVNMAVGTNRFHTEISNDKPTPFGFIQGDLLYKVGLVGTEKIVENGGTPKVVRDEIYEIDGCYFVVRLGYYRSSSIYDVSGSIYYMVYGSKDLLSWDFITRGKYGNTQTNKGVEGTTVSLTKRMNDDTLVLTFFNWDTNIGAARLKEKPLGYFTTRDSVGNKKPGFTVEAGTLSTVLGETINHMHIRDTIDTGLGYLSVSVHKLTDSSVDYGKLYLRMQVYQKGGLSNSRKKEIGVDMPGISKPNSIKRVKLSHAGGVGRYLLTVNFTGFGDAVGKITTVVFLMILKNDTDAPIITFLNSVGNGYQNLDPVGSIPGLGLDLGEGFSFSLGSDKVLYGVTTSSLAGKRGFRVFTTKKVDGVIRTWANKPQDDNLLVINPKQRRFVTSYDTKDPQRNLRLPTRYKPRG